MLVKNVGLYAARVVAASKMEKQLALAGPPQMQLNRDTQEFIIDIPGPVGEGNPWHNKEDARYVEIYVRTTGDPLKIKYGVADNERIKVDTLKLVHR